MRRALTFAVVALSLFSFPALPQQAPTTGSIEGIVVRADTDQPIANAQVTLTQIAEVPTPGAAAAANGAAAAIVPVITGADGKFSFKDLKSAAYRAAATTDSFVRMTNGQRVPNDLGRLLFVDAGQSVTGVTIRITPAGAITGRILDENGQPATGAQVQLIRAGYNVRGKIYQGAGFADVDDRGVYRIFAVPPGRYYLMAGTQPGAASLIARGLGANSTWYSVRYYPNVSTLYEADTIEVKAGDESSVDMRLKREAQTFHVRGRAINPNGAPFPQNTRVGLGSNQLSSFVTSNKPEDRFDPATGTFDISSVTPGEFYVVIHQTPQPPGAPGGAGPIPNPQVPRAMELAASVPIRVTNADIDGLVITLAAGVAVQGKLIVEGQPISAVPNIDQLRFNIQPPKLLGLGVPTSSAIDAAGNFQVAGMRDGEYLSWINLNSPGFYVHSIKYGGKEILGTTFKFSSGDPGTFEVVLKAGVQTVSGKVTDSQSQPVPGIAVVFIPSHRERFDLFRSTNTDRTGKFTMMNLAPGEYKVFSWEAVDNNAYMDPDFLKPYEELGKAISVTEFSNSSVDVKLIPAQ